MEISGIFGQNQAMSLPLSEEQKETLSEILSRYDSENMTADDHKALRDEITEAGIPRCRETFDMLREAGFGPPKGVGVNRNQMLKHGQGLDLDDEESEDWQGGGTGLQKGQWWDVYQQFKDGEINEEEFLSRVQQYAAGSILDVTS